MERIHNNLNIENLTKTEWFNQFDKGQQKEILKGLKNNIDVSKYANEVFKWSQMREIREGLHDDLDVSIYAKPEFDCGQMRAIRFSLIDEL